MLFKYINKCLLLPHLYQQRHLLQLGIFLYLTLYRHSPSTDSKDKTNHPVTVLILKVKVAQRYLPSHQLKKYQPFPLLLSQVLSPQFLLYLQYLLFLPKLEYPLFHYFLLLL